MFGGTSIERTISQQLQRGDQRSEPAALLRRLEEQHPVDDRRSSWRAPYPLPWYGITRERRATRRWPACRSARRRCSTASSRRAPASPSRTASAPNYLVTRDHDLPGQLQGRRARRARCVIPGLTVGVGQPPAGRAGHGVHAAHQPGRLRREQDVQVRHVALHAEAGHLQRAQLGRLHVGQLARSSTRATYLQPSVVLQGRIIRIGVDVKW